MMERKARVFVHANDAVSRAGIGAQLRSWPELLVVEDSSLGMPHVAVIVVDEVDDEALTRIRTAKRAVCCRVLLVAGKFDQRGLLAAVEAGASCFLRRGTLSSETLHKGVLAVLAGDGSVPPDLLSRLVAQVSSNFGPQPAPLLRSFGDLDKRETEVLRLLADGYDTAAVARQLSYSERTVKNVLQDITRRHRLRNRTHAVAFALRQGLI